MSKILEKAFKGQLQVYLENNHFLASNLVSEITIIITNLDSKNKVISLDKKIYAKLSIQS